MDVYRKMLVTQVGPGGLRCPCCGYMKHERKIMRRRARAKLKAFDRRERWD